MLLEQFQHEEVRATADSGDAYLSSLERCDVSNLGPNV
jgi:hypothetical protein